jgi:hypothetical protein
LGAKVEAVAGQEDDGAPAAEGDGHAEEEKKEPEPEPEPDPMEGLTYDGDPHEPRIVNKIKGFIKTESRLLVIDTGKSDLAPKIVAAGVEGVTAIDFASGDREVALV